MSYYLSQRRTHKIFSLLFLMLLILLSISACGSDQRVHQQADQYKADLDKAIAHARSIGVPAQQLQPILLQQVELNSSHAPITFFSDQPVNDYYTNLAKRYQLLLLQVHGVTNIVAEQHQAQALATTRLNKFRTDIDQMKQYGNDVSDFQKRYDDSQRALNSAKTLNDILKVSSQIDQDMTSIQLPLLETQANSELKKFHQEVKDWGKTHQFTSTFGGSNSFPLDYEYDVAEGFGRLLDDAVQNAKTADDYQAAITSINDQMLHLKAMEADAEDQTAWKQIHATDTQLINHYHFNQGPVLVVSFIEQSLRSYQDGKLVRAFQVTTGRFERPSPPGVFKIKNHLKNITFKSGDSPTSPFYYKDTHINYAMEYRAIGFFFHDSWWRHGYGVGTNFPHFDPDSDNNGSHGCINMQKDEIAWLFGQIPNGAEVILY